MRLASIAAVLGFALLLGGSVSAAPSGSIAAALADPARPAADRERDAERKAAEIAALAEVAPGDKVADIFPGGGYFTRILSKAVGPAGKVYAVLPEPATRSPFRPLDAAKALVAEPAYAGNTVLLVQPMPQFKPPEPLDLVFNSQFHHDFHNEFYGGPDARPAIKAVFDALKPGGIYLVIDHAAADGSGVRDTNTIHRIDRAAVEAETKAAGFLLEASSDLLRNPADPRTANVFAPAIRGRTDQFILKFRKPG